MKSICESRPNIERVAALAHARSSRYRHRLEEANRIIKRGLSIVPDAYVSCSFGKDSAVMLHMILQHAPDISVRFLMWTESEYLNNYQEVIAAWQARVPSLNLTIVTLGRESLDDKVAGRWQALEDVTPTTGHFIGLRAEESKGRRITLSMHGPVYQRKNGMWRFAPVATWQHQDIAAYIFTHDLPMLDTYHVEGLQARTASRVPRKVVRAEALSALRLRDPQRFERLADEYPEVKEWVI